MSRSLKGVLMAVLVLTLSAIAVWFYYYQVGLINQAQDKSSVRQNVSNLKSEEPKEIGFSPVTAPSIPPFVKELKNTNDVKIDFHYEGDYASSSDWGTPEFYTPEGSTEKFLDLSSVRDREKRYNYGPENLSIFKSQESHSYQGTPVYLSDSNSKYSVSYVGFQISNRDLVSDLKIEFGIDYLASTLSENKPEVSNLTSIFRTKTAYACGPGLFLRPMGSSNLIFAEESNGITWYRLEKPIALYNLSLTYCDTPPKNELSYCKNSADDPAECLDYCQYNASVTNLENGNLRMHIFYLPNDKAGLLRIQVANIILSDSAGGYYQPVMGKYFDRYYRAYFH